MSAQLLGEVVAFQDPKEPVSLADVRNALAIATLPADAAAELSPRSAFSRACKDLKENRQIDRVETNGREAKFQLTRKDEISGEIHFLRETFVFLDLDGGIIRCEDAEIEKQARDLFAEAMNARTSNDITKIVKTMFATNADLFPLVPAKGVAYFVPEKFREFTTKIDTFYKALGGMLCRFPVPAGTPEGNASVKDAVDQGLDTLAADLMATVDAWDETTRNSTMEKAIEKWQAISYKVDAYGEYLGAAQGKLRETLDNAKAALAVKIAAVGEAKEAKKNASEATEQPLLATV